MKSNNTECKPFQDKLIAAANPTGLMEIDTSLKIHIDKCAKCRLFAKSITIIREQMQRSPGKDLKPNRKILINARKLMRVRQEFQMSKNNSLWQSLRQIVEYRIPAYQAVSGLVVMIILVFFLSGTMMPPETPWADGNRSGRIEGANGSDLYAVDSLNLLKPDRGQNAKEDSVLVGFLVPTL